MVCGCGIWSGWVSGWACHVVLCGVGGWWVGVLCGVGVVCVCGMWSGWVSGCVCHVVLCGVRGCVVLCGVGVAYGVGGLVGVLCCVVLCCVEWVGGGYAQLRCTPNVVHV